MTALPLRQDEAAVVDAKPKPSPTKAGGAAASTADTAIEQLRSILIGPDHSLIERTHRRVSDPFQRARDIGEVLPEALAEAAARGEHSGQSARPLVEGAIQASVKRDPLVLAESLFPAIGPAIRKAVAEALQSFAQSLNQTIEHAVSWRAWRWRFEAWRSGRPFGEVVLRHTLIYRVEQVFLIHRDTGLLLQHVTPPTLRNVEDAGLVSGMLTAIQDFARDSFGLDQGSQLEHLEVGDLTVWLESGPRAIVAAVVRGHAPVEYRLRVREACERIHGRFASLLQAFDGDPKPFATADAMLLDCLVEERADGSAPSYWRLWVIGAIVAALLITGGYAMYRRVSRWQGYVSALRTQPGLIVTSASRGLVGYRVTGVRDPLAADPAALLAPADIDPASVDASWGIVQTLEPSFVLERARRLLAPPSTVNLSLEGDRLRATGSAPHAWLAEAGGRARFIPGVASADLSPVVDLDRQRLAATAATFEQRPIPFGLAAVRLTWQGRAALASLSHELLSFVDACRAVGITARIVVRGSADEATGSPQTNARIAGARALAVVEGLAAAGVPRALMSTDASAGVARQVSVRVELPPPSSP